MGKEYPIINSKIAEWISRQRVFFVSTAPLSSTGSINCSPKGLDTFRIIGDRTIAYLDFTGSGIETIAHLKENKRIVIMMCAFDGPPKIFRFHGKGVVFEKDSDDYRRTITNFVEYPGTRSIIQIEVDRISDSCGYSVPLYEFQGDRDGLLKWAENKGDTGILEYQKNNNQLSFDGLTGLGQ